MRSVIRTLPRKCRAGRKKASITPHDHINLHPTERSVVKIVAADRGRDETDRGTETWCMIARAEVVVDRLRNMIRDKRITLLLGLLRDDARGIGGIVAANVEEVSDLEALELLEDLAAVLGSRFKTTAAERARWRVCNREELLLAHLLEVKILALHNTGNAVHCAIDSADSLRLARSKNRANE